MSRRKNFRQSNWLIELSLRKNVESRVVGIRSTFSRLDIFPPSGDPALGHMQSQANLDNDYKN